MGKLSRVWKHSKRAVSKNVFRNKAHKDNLREMEKLLLQFSPSNSDRVALCPSQVPKSKKINFKHGQFNFEWLKDLSDEDFFSFNGAWIATLQGHARESANTDLQTAAFEELRVDFFKDQEKGKEAKKFQKERWIDLQTIKDHYKGIATEGKGAFSRFKRWKGEKKTSMEDKIHRNKLLGPYLTRAHDLQSALSAIESSTDGPRNSREVKQMLGLGIYKFIKGGVKITKSVFSGKVHKVAKGGVRVLDSLGGLIGGITDLCRHKQADFRKLSSRLGISQKLSQKGHNLFVGHEKGSLDEQMDKGPGSLLRSQKFNYEKQIEKLRSSTRQALYWCDIWKKDIAEIERDIDTLKNRPWNEELRQILKAAESEGQLKPSQIKKTKNNQIVKEINQRVQEETQSAQKLKKKVQDWEKDLKRRLKELDDLMSGTDTRKSIGDTQMRLASTGVGFNAPKELAREIATFDKRKLKEPKEQPFQKSRSKKKKSLDEEIRESMSRRRKRMGYTDGEDD